MTILYFYFLGYLFIPALIALLMQVFCFSNKLGYAITAILFLIYPFGIYDVYLSLNHPTPVAAILLASKYFIVYLLNPLFIVPCILYYHSRCIVFWRNRIVR